MIIVLEGQTEQEAVNNARHLIGCKGHIRRMQKCRDGLGSFMTSGKKSRMNPIEYRVVYLLLGAALASSVLLGSWLWTQTYVQQEFLFHQKWESEEHQKDLDRRIEAAVYRVWEIEKQKENFNTPR